MRPWILLGSLLLVATLAVVTLIRTRVPPSEPGPTLDALLVQPDSSLDPDSEGGRTYRPFIVLQTGSRLVLNASDVSRFSPDGGVEWTTPTRTSRLQTSGGLITLEDGGVVALCYHRMSDSGAQLVRLDSRTGERTWESYCSGLGVFHSEYYHVADVQAVGEHLRVMSRGSSGAFVEILELKTGKSVGRREWLPRFE